MYVESEDQLRQIYGHPKGRAKDKLLTSLEYHSRNFIRHSPFVIVSTRSGSGSVDCSPRGGNPGFVEIVDDRSILLPDSKGNNRLDSFINIVEAGEIGCLFLIPGVDETLRVNGVARISIAADHLDQFSHLGNPPKACIEIGVREVFLHCAKAFMRSRLWSPDVRIDRSDFPSMATMINDQLAIKDPPETQEAMIARYQADL